MTGSEVGVKGESGIEVDLRAGNAQDLPLPLRHVEDAGLVVERLERSKLDIVEWLVTASHRF